MLEAIECFSRISENQRRYIISVPALIDFLIGLVRIVIPLSANPTKWSNTQQFVDNGRQQHNLSEIQKGMCIHIFIYSYSNVSFVEDKFSKILIDL